MNYDDCRTWLENRRQTMGSVPGLDEVTKLLEVFNRPEEGLKILHIAGTNGKGSVGYYLENILALSKIKTGRFLSPAVMNEREIILVNSHMVPKTKWAENLTKIIEAVEKHNINATAFEIETVLSLLIFKEMGCEVAIMECGMGGRLDATNAIKHDLVDIITSISYDHCNFLGDTLKEISLHKFGIIKEDSKFVVLAPQSDEVYEYFNEYVNSTNYVNCENIVSSDIKKARYKTIKSKYSVSQVFTYKSYVNLKLSQAGDYQIDNAICVLDVCEVLLKEGFMIKESAVAKTFENAKWNCRFELIRKDNRLYILDGAHNPDAVKRLMNNLSLYFTNRELIYIMGMYKDKDYEEVVSMCVPKAKAVVTVNARDRKRTLDKFELGNVIRKYNSNVTCSDSYYEALEMASLLAQGDDIVVVFGSLSFLGEMREYLCK